MINQLDTQAFLWLNSLHNDFFDPMMLWITSRNSWFPMYAAIVGSIVWTHKRKSIGILLMIIFSVIISDQVCSSILKPLIQRLRPCHEPTIQNLVHLVSNCGGQFGFCSSHAANTFALVKEASASRSEVMLFTQFWYSVAVINSESLMMSQMRFFSLPNILTFAKSSCLDKRHLVYWFSVFVSW